VKMPFQFLKCYGASIHKAATNHINNDRQHKGDQKKAANICCGF